MKTSYIALLAVLGVLLVGSGPAEAYVGYGYRANESVRGERCYRSPAWDYAVPFYMFGPKDRYYRKGCCCKPPARRPSHRRSDHRPSGLR